MADRIKMLPESVANQIAAGEVVNRPSSVVKELLENAVDAGSKNITVNFRDGGKALIMVADDGCGMSEPDARLAFERHATSKISNVEDIYHLGTFGFRGEALASIASVSEVELRTRQAGSELGTKVEINGGKFVSQSSVNTPNGTQFHIRNLFYNVPARRRFLEKSSTEARHIVAEYQRVVLCNPHIGFTLFDSDTQISRLPASNLRQRIVGAMGKHISKNLLELSTKTSIVTIEGFVGSPLTAKQTNKEQYLFVNGRYFKNPYFHKAVVSAYDKLIQPNTQPSYFVYLSVDPQRIDVNVHPQKTEVKFSDGSDMWQIINAAVRESLAKSGAVPPMDFELDDSLEIPVFDGKRTQYRQPSISANPDFNPFEKYQAGEGFDTADLSDASDEDYDRSILDFIEGDTGQSNRQHTFGFGSDSDLGSRSYGSDRTGEHPLPDPNEEAAGEREVITIGGRYAATELGGALVLIDLRRAREAVLYCRYISMLGSESSTSQQLLFPEKVILSGDDSRLLAEYMADFVAFGFELTLADEYTVEISAVPGDFTGSSCEAMIHQLLDVLRDTGTGTDKVRQQTLAASIAREGAAKVAAGGLSPQQAHILVRELGEWDYPAYTPSAGKVMTALSAEALAKLIER